MESTFLYLPLALGKNFLFSRFCQENNRVTTQRIEDIRFTRRLLRLRYENERTSESHSVSKDNNLNKSREKDYHGIIC